MTYIFAVSSRGIWLRQNALAPSLRGKKIIDSLGTGPPRGCGEKINLILLRLPDAPALPPHTEDSHFRQQAKRLTFGLAKWLTVGPAKRLTKMHCRNCPSVDYSE